MNLRFYSLINAVALAGFCGFSQDLKGKQGSTTDISSIDRNFRQKDATEKRFVFFSAKEKPLRLEGLPWRGQNKENYFYRLPASLTEKEVNPRALSLAANTSGAVVRFRSAAPEICIKAVLGEGFDMGHMPRTGSCGFDCFRKTPEQKLPVHNGTFRPKRDQTDVLAVIGRNPDRLTCDWIINLPLYGGVKELWIGVPEGEKILPPSPHKVERPICFYGSSITQGGCASRPGNTYSSMLCREVDAEQINLGFSGSGLGETAVAEAIASLNLSVFILDYDHNAPDVEHLKATHEKFFKIVRTAQPELPILVISRCDFRDSKVDTARRSVVRETVENAKKAGDKRVWFIDGETLFGTDHRDLCTVDGIHPNDLGFYRMFQTILPYLNEALKPAP